jgi:hypothetical protein
MDKTCSWDGVFQRKHVIERLEEGPFSAYLAEFNAFLRDQRYSETTIRRSICSADYFGRWLAEQKLSLAEAHEGTVSCYCNSLGRCKAGDWPHRVKGLRLAVRFLEERGIAARESKTGTPCLPVAEWLGQFERYLERVVGAKTSTGQRYRPILLRFLNMRFGSGEPDWSLLVADDLTAFIQREAAHARGFGRKVPGVALRSFLRFESRFGTRRTGRRDSVAAPVSSRDIAGTRHG